MRPSYNSDALEQLESAFAETCEGRGRLTVVRGGPGCGKTALLRTFAQRVTSEGTLFVSATASPAESELQGGVLDQFFRSVELPPETTKLVERLIAAGMRGTPGLGSILQRVAPMVHEVCGALLELSRPRPVVIAVDDAQFADSASLQLLLYLARRMRSMRVLIVLTECGSAQSLPLLRSELTRCPHQVITVGPLSEEASSTVVAQALGKRVSADLAASFHQTSGGNPLLLKALIEDHKRAQQEESSTSRVRADATSAAVGAHFAEAIVACLHGSGSELLDVAQGIAVFGDQSDPELVGRLMGVHRDDTTGAIRILSAAGLLRNGHLPHPAAETAVLSTLRPEARSALHLRASELLYQRGAAAIEVARQVIAAEQVPDPWTVPVLRTAAGQALTGDGVTMAVRCLEVALRGATDEEDRLAITADLAQALWRVNPSATARYVPPLQAAVYDGSLPTSAVMAVVRYSLWNGDTETAGDLVRALGDAGHLEDAQLAVELRLAYQWYCGMEHHRFENPRAEAKVGGEPWSRAADHLATVWNHEQSDTATDSAEQILQSCRLEDSTVEVVAYAVLVIARGNRLERASWWCGQLLDEAHRHGAVVWQMLLRSLQAMILLRRGRVPSATAQAEKTLGLMSAQHWGVLIGLPLATLISANTAAGRYEAASALLRQKVPEAMFRTVYGLYYLHARGHYYLATDRVLAAVSDFQRCGRLMQDWSLDIASLIPWRSSLAQAYLKLGHTRAARELVSNQLKNSKTLDNRVTGISLRVLATCSDLSQRTTLLRQAVERLEKAGDRIELSRALEDLSGVYQQLNEFDRARLLARRAAQESKACHSSAPTIPAQRVAEHPSDARETSPRPRPTADAVDVPLLSDAQRRVAELAALGHTNQEISRRLYITVSTVEQHLTRVFRKLGVHSRNDLPLTILDDVS